MSALILAYAIWYPPPPPLLPWPIMWPQDVVVRSC